VEGEQVQQVVVAGGGDDLEAAHAVGRLAAVQRLDGAQVGDLLEQLDQVVGLLGSSGPTSQLQLRARRLGAGPGLRPGAQGCSGPHRRGRGARARRAPPSTRAGCAPAAGGVDRLGAGALVARQQAP
jgi:hypothetical protein